MRTLWQRFVRRHRRIMAELAQIELEMAQEEVRDAPTIFPKRPYKIWTIMIFFVFIFFVALAFWAFVKNLP